MSHYSVGTKTALPSANTPDVSFFGSPGGGGIGIGIGMGIGALGSPPIPAGVSRSRREKELESVIEAMRKVVDKLKVS